MAFPSLAGYSANDTDEQNYTSAGAGSLIVTFGSINLAYDDTVLEGGTPAWKDYLYVCDASGNVIATLWGQYPSAEVVVPGETVIIRLEASRFSTAAGDPSYGYSVSNIDTAAALSIDTASLPNATVGQPYHHALTITGGRSPYGASLTAGALPGGLSLSRGGAISGAPTAAGTFNFTVQVLDSDGTTESAALTLTVDAASVLAISTASLPDGQAGVYYRVVLAATGGRPTYIWSQASGELPSGLRLSSGGVISGAPLQSGSFTIDVQVSDSRGATASATLTLDVIAYGTLYIVGVYSIPSGYVGVPYYLAVLAAGGTAPDTWAISAGALPDGVTLNPTANSETCELRGTPTTPGTFNFTLQVTDGASATATVNWTITVYGSGDTGDDGGTVGPNGLRITTASLPNAELGKQYSATLAATGGTPPRTLSVSAGALPPGLSMSNGGEISGTAAGAGTFSFTAQVTDSAAGTATKAFSIVVGQTAALEGEADWFVVSLHEGGTGGSGSNLEPIQEVPLGAYNGSNTSFKLSKVPSGFFPGSCSLRLTVNGILQNPFREYSLAQNVVTFTIAPKGTDEVIAWYFPGSAQTPYTDATVHGLCGLMGAFTDAGGNVIKPVWIGKGPIGLLVPAGATQLQLGTNDDLYGDNFYSFAVTVNGAAHTVWATMMPWTFAGGINAAYDYGTKSGIDPLVIPVTAGSVVTVSATGTIATGNMANPDADADGAGGDHTGTGSSGTYFPAHYITR